MLAGTGRFEAEFKSEANGGGVNVSPDPRAPSLCVGCDVNGCDSCWVLGGIWPVELGSLVSPVTGDVDAGAAPKLGLASPRPKAKAKAK